MTFERSITLHRRLVQRAMRHPKLGRQRHGNSLHRGHDERHDGCILVSRKQHRDNRRDAANSIATDRRDPCAAKAVVGPAGELTTAFVAAHSSAGTATGDSLVAIPIARSAASPSVEAIVLRAARFPCFGWSLAVADARSVP